MAKAPMLGKQAKHDLPDALFAEEFHEGLVHEAARADLAARRRGTASTLGRSEIAMTTAKAWRQKGTGRARAGALSTPQRRGGGVAFGPKPRRHAFKVNRKARRRALRVALSVHAARGTIAVVPADAFAEPSTKQAAGALAKWGAEGSVLVVIDRDEVATLKSFRNLPGVTVMPASGIGVADLLAHSALVVSEPALDILGERAGEVVRSGAAGPPESAPAGGEREAKHSGGGGA
jgi:large subunit ribosomal protein L4